MKDGNPLKKQHRRPFAFTGDDDPTSKGGFETQTLRRVDTLIVPQNCQKSIKTQSGQGALAHAGKLGVFQKNFDIFPVAVKSFARFWHVQPFIADRCQHISLCPANSCIKRFWQRACKANFSVVQFQCLRLCGAERYHRTQARNSSARFRRNDHNRAHLNHFRHLKACCVIANQNLPHAGRIENRHTLLKVLSCYENRRIRFHQITPSDRAFPIQQQTYQITQTLQDIPIVKQFLTVPHTTLRTCKQFLHVRVVKESLTTEIMQGHQP